jgi:hypothetical protein
VVERLIIQIRLAFAVIQAEHFDHIKPMVLGVSKVCTMIIIMLTSVAMFLFIGSIDSIPFFPYRTKAERAELTREEQVFFPVERTGPPGGGQPAATPGHFPSRVEPGHPGTHTQTTCTMILYR